jgi:N4-gp56 family major capsid protein
MAIYDNLNRSTDAGISASVVDYHEKGLLKWIKENTTWTRDMQMRPLPLHNGRRVQFRRFIPFEPTMKPLEEGVTKNGHKLRQTEMWATVKPYGEHVEITDELNLYNIDDMHREINKELSYSADITIDNLAMEAKCSGTNVQYAGAKTSRATLAAADILTPQDIKKAVRTLKNNHAQKFPDGYYHANVDPDTIFDLTASQQWIDVATYQDKRKFETGELGIMYGVKFFDGRSKIYETGNYVAYSKSDDDTTGIASLTITAYDKTAQTVTIGAGFNEYVARQLVMHMFTIGGSGSGAGQLIYVDKADVATKTLHLRWAPATDLANGDTILPEAAGAAGVDVHAMVIYGQDYCGGVSLGGNGHNIRVIIKPVGSSGSNDPYDQRGTMAWKAKGLCYTVLQDAFAVRIEYAVSA